MFVCTANSLNIPTPLLDRMEIIRIPGYIEDEKLNIASKYLLPKQMERNGLKDKNININIRELVSLDIHSYLYTHHLYIYTHTGR